MLSPANAPMPALLPPLAVLAVEVKSATAAARSAISLALAPRAVEEATDLSEATAAPAATKKHATPVAASDT